jgi:phosphonate transport system permease protein
MLSRKSPSPSSSIFDFFERIWEFIKSYILRTVIQTKAARKTVLADGVSITKPYSFGLLNMVILLLITFYFWDLIVTTYFTVTPFELFVRRIPNFINILTKMVTDFKPDYLPTVIPPLIDTIQMAIIGTFLGAFLALPVAFLASQNLVKSKIITNFIKLILSFIRTIPTLVYAAILAFAFGYGTLIGVIATAIFTFGILTKMLYEVIETIDLGAFMAIESTGATKTKAFITSVVPQIMGTFLSFTLYSFEINIRSSAILGYVGAGGIGILLDDHMTWREYGHLGLILAVLLVVVFVIENISRFIRKKMS